MSLFKEFKPALYFLGKFLALYFAGNILYGLYVESYGDKPDGMTWWTSSQTSSLLKRMGYEADLGDVPGTRKVALIESGDVVLFVFEGCNGINVMIVFAAFLFAFGGRWKALTLFLAGGLVIIHLCNLLRIVLLYYLAESRATEFYYYHKYVFTATLYLVVFGLWALWVIRFNERRKIKAAAS